MMLIEPQKGTTRHHRPFINQLVKLNGWTHGCELGLGSGKLHHLLLQDNPQLTMVGVDIGAKPEWRNQHKWIAKEYKPRTRVIHESTDHAVNRVPDKAFDFIFIDAAHGYSAVQKDIKNWTRKLKPGGVLFGHDFHVKFPGVIRAVKEAFGPGGFFVTEHHIWVRKNADWT